MDTKNEKGIIELSWEELSLISGGDCDVSSEDPCGDGGDNNEHSNLGAQGSYATTYDESGGP